MFPTLIPHGRTARRLAWAHLPPLVRRAVEQRLGSPVVDAVSQDGGFTPGFASVLTCADGTRAFVKAASVKAQRVFADAYREEARKLAALPAVVPAPRLLWTDEVADWRLLATEYVDARAPYRPWRPDDLAAASAMAVAMAAVLTPAPGAALDSAVDEFASWPALWDRVVHPRGAEIRALAERYPEVVAGDTLVHTDIRDDNILVRPDGTALLCDWNWPIVGAAWLDSLLLLIGPRGDGLDVDVHIAAHPLLATVPDEHIDVFLALILGYFTASAQQPVPATSPHLRAAQAWQRDVIDHWLAERRGWSGGR
ncbi:phosphotransferase [Nocardioides sp. LHD-245]|uniref:phosphotransferase n=1 Tax=Nocardioides sp. LHD-245 TaxID=3051387 RepID=UPI0027E170C1|nr:phosphotransferase [Nocardioides sp. LHD-245]